MTIILIVAAVAAFVAAYLWAVIADGEPGARFPRAVSAGYALAGLGAAVAGVLLWVAL